MKQCRRCNAVLEDAANFCAACGSSEFITGMEGKAASYNNNIPGGNGVPQQAAGNPVQGYQ